MLLRLVASQTLPEAGGHPGERCRGGRVVKECLANTQQRPCGFPNRPLLARCAHGADVAWRLPAQTPPPPPPPGGDVDFSHSPTICLVVPLLQPLVRFGAHLFHLRIARRRGGSSSQSATAPALQRRCCFHLHTVVSISMRPLNGGPPGPIAQKEPQTANGPRIELLAVQVGGCPAQRTPRQPPPLGRLHEAGTRGRRSPALERRRLRAPSPAQPLPRASGRCLSPACSQSTASRQGRQPHSLARRPTAPASPARPPPPQPVPPSRNHTAPLLPPPPPTWRCSRCRLCWLQLKSTRMQWPQLCTRQPCPCPSWFSWASPLACGCWHVGAGRACHAAPGQRRPGVGRLFDWRLWCMHRCMLPAWCPHCAVPCPGAFRRGSLPPSPLLLQIALHLPRSHPPTHPPSPLLLLPSLCRFIGLGFSTCALVGGTLSPEFRKAQPGAFAALYS